MDSYHSRSNDRMAECLVHMARKVIPVTQDISELDNYNEQAETAPQQSDAEDEEATDDDDGRQSVEAMLASGSTDDEQAEWMDEVVPQPRTNTPATDDEYDGSLTPTPSHTASPRHTTASPLQLMPFHSIAADRQQPCQQHGEDCPCDGITQSRAAIVTSRPRHVTPPYDSAHQQLVNTLTSPAANTKRHFDAFLSPPPPLHEYSHYYHSSTSNNNKENVSPHSSLHTPSARATLKTSPQSAFSAVNSRTPSSAVNGSDSAAAESKRRKTVHASLTRSFQSLPVEQSQQSRGSSGYGGTVGGAVLNRARRVPR